MSTPLPNRWWSGNPAERFWCEITDRNDVGNDLKCPQTDESSREYWSYSLIREIEPGDIVFHYWTPERAVVGASIAGDYARDYQFEWTPHGTVGRSRNVRREPRPAWRLYLRHFVRSATPLNLTDVVADQVWLRDWLDRKRRSGAVMAPFMPYRDTIRGYQGYLTKMPLDFVDRCLRSRLWWGVFMNG